MRIMCWACTNNGDDSIYEDSLLKCPFCGVPKERPEPVKAEPKGKEAKDKKKVK
jgi:hypothetical protein